MSYYQLRQAYDDQNFLAAKTYLNAYQTCYPFDKTHFAQACFVRYWDSVHSLWVETEHYLNDNHRVDGFLPGTLQKLRYLSQHQDQFVNRLISSLEI